MVFFIHQQSVLPPGFLLLSLCTVHVLLRNFSFKFWRKGKSKWFFFISLRAMLRFREVFKCWISSCLASLPLGLIPTYPPASTLSHPASWAKPGLTLPRIHFLHRIGACFCPGSSHLPPLQGDVQLLWSLLLCGDSTAALPHPESIPGLLQPGMCPWTPPWWLHSSLLVTCAI